jgi:hypothetical protein
VRQLLLLLRPANEFAPRKNRSAQRAPGADEYSGVGAGASWQHHYLLEDAPDHGFAYTAIHFVGDAVLLAHCAGGITTKTMLDRLRVRRIPLAKFYGK